jgi:multicomponent Na+:H+ antiporter subunit B
LKKALAAVFIGLLVILLWYVVSQMPEMGDPGNPTNANTAPRYLQEGVEEGGAENIITGIILNYRGYDTMGEVSVIFSALAAVLAVVGRGKKKGQWAALDRAKVQPTYVIRSAVLFLVPMILLFSLYVMLHGDTSPGGGFQGGAVIGASLIIFTIIFGLTESIRRIPASFRIPLEGIAPFGFFTVGMVGILAGANFLTYILPPAAASVQPAVRTWMLEIIEIGIGVGGAIIFTSILFALLREDEPTGGLGQTG